MKALDRWWRAQARSAGRRPFLEESLLTGRSWRYAVYRLRYVMARALLRTMLHLVEVVLFVNIFSTEAIGPILAVRNLALAFGALWWGALERLRAEVRAEALVGHVMAAKCAVDNWLALAMLIALAQQGLGAAWVVFGPSPFSSFSIFDAYVLACCARLGLDTVSRTYHSGIFALKRVYRPWWSLIVVDVLDVAVVIALWPWVGLWGFSLSMLTVGALRTALSIHFAKRAYATSVLSVRPQRRNLFRGLRAQVWPWSQMLRDGLGNTVAQLDALLIVAMLSGPSDEPGLLLLVAFLHVLSPMLNAAFAWARVFYFDLKRVELWRMPLLQRRLERLLGHVALVIPLPIGLVVALLLVLFWNGRSAELVVSVVAFVAARAWFAVRQVRAFSFGASTYLLRLALLVALVCFLVAEAPKEPTLVLALASAGLALAIVVAGALPTGATNEVPWSAQPWLGLPHWIQQVGAWPGEIRVGILRVAGPRGSIARVARAMRQVLGAGAMTRLDARHIVWFESTAWASRRVLARAGAGCLSELYVTPVCPNGMAALQSGVPVAAWQRTVEASRNLLAEQDPTQRSLEAVSRLQTIVRDGFPQTRLVPLREGILPSRSGVPREARNAVTALLGALRGRLEYRPRGTHTHYTVLASGADPLALGITVEPSEKSRLSSLRQIVTALSIAASIPRVPESIDRQQRGESEVDPKHWIPQDDGS